MADAQRLRKESVTFATLRGPEIPPPGPLTAHSHQRHWLMPCHVSIPSCPLDGACARTPSSLRTLCHGEATKGSKGIPSGTAQRSRTAVGFLRRLILVCLLQAGTSIYSIAAQPLSNHWAYRPIVRPIPPTSTSPKKNEPPTAPIDAWIQLGWQQHSLTGSPREDRAILARRSAIDITGLPPTESELKSFLADTSSAAYERWVDRLLASPHYGERWGRWWLDAARYADSNGYSIDSTRSIWPYRDWVVRALNADMPFDRFTLWQLAGDLLSTSELPPGTDPKDPVIATGFHRNTQVNHEGGIDPEQFRVESVVDRVNTTATVWLGLTFGCAQCHDHKYDPFTQADYYSFLAYFNSCENDGHGNAALEAENVLELASPEELQSRDTLRAEIRKQEKALAQWVDSTLRPKQSEWEHQLSPEARKKFSSLIQDLLQQDPATRNVDQSNLVSNAYRDQDPGYRERHQTLQKLKSTEPHFVKSLVMKERPEPRETHLLIKGDFTRPGARVEARTPAALPALMALQDSHSRSNRWGRPTRLDLARWLTQPNQPLTSRVIANRVWQQCFGKGLVETENDFGRQGTPPTHPELLDWLASEFRDQGWSLKHLIRTLVTSQTYQQSSKLRPEFAESDPSNRWLSRQSRWRLDAECIRDGLLRASGLLDERIGGPPVFPPQPQGLGAFTQNDRPWKTSEGKDRYRRALYTHLQRTTLHPALAVFDAPDTFQTCTRRLRSNTPLQALTLMNDPAFTEMETALASRILSEKSRASDGDRLTQAFIWCTSRPPTKIERSKLEQFLKAERRAHATPEGEAQVWRLMARVLMNLDATLTRE